MANQWANAMQSMGGTNQTGQGAGNIPYAPGVMSGQYQGQQLPQDNRQGGGISGLYASLHQQQGMDNAKSQMQQFTSGADPAQLGQPQQGGINWTPDAQRQVMQYLMQVLKNTRSGDQVSTTGGMTGRGY